MITEFGSNDCVKLTKEVCKSKLPLNEAEALFLFNTSFMFSTSDDFSSLLHNLASQDKVC